MLPTRAGHRLRGAIARNVTETPAAGHQKATDPDSGVNQTAQVPSR